MGTAKLHDAVRLITGVLTAFPDLFDAAAEACEREFGPIELRSDTFDFDFTDYYAEEMGAPIKRRFFSFRDRIDPAGLADIKLRTNIMERRIADAFRKPVPRPVNLDPGYLTLSKLVLATTKDYAHRIYLRDGIYADIGQNITGWAQLRVKGAGGAEITLRYHKGRFEAMPWTYPDYRTEAYHRFFLQVRETCRERSSDSGGCA